MPCGCRVDPLKSNFPAFQPPGCSHSTDEPLAGGSRGCNSHKHTNWIILDQGKGYATYETLKCDIIFHYKIVEVLP